METWNRLTAKDQGIPNWDKDDTRLALREYGLKQDYSAAELDEAIIDYRRMLTLWKAQQWDQLQAAKPAVTKRVIEAPTLERPGPTRGSERDERELLARARRGDKAAASEALEGRLDSLVNNLFGKRSRQRVDLPYY